MQVAKQSQPQAEATTALHRWVRCFLATGAPPIFALGLFFDLRLPPISYFLCTNFFGITLYSALLLPPPPHLVLPLLLPPCAAR